MDCATPWTRGCVADDDRPVLTIRGLTIDFVVDKQVNRVVEQLDLDVWPGETVGLVGETGCGKSVTALSILGLIGSPGKVTEGQILFDGRDLRTLNPEALRRIRGEGISMIFQEPMTSLDPSFTIGTQIGEVLGAHQGLRGGVAAAEAKRILEVVRMPHAERVLKQYPFELSGGMRQRVMIAMALACHPKFLIADEPTTALDVTVQAQILALLEELQRDTGMALLLITHDLGIVAENCDRVYVMYAGRVAEHASVQDLFEQPLHPYTTGLIGAIPSLDARQARLADIPGEVAMPSVRLPGCRFAPRCAHVMPVCTSESPALSSPRADHAVACYLHA
jgi:peptide/nickel transport system ATP-binding protein